MKPAPWFVYLAAVALAGCGKPPSLPTPDAEPAVSVSKVVVRDVVDSVDFTGRIDAVNYVDVKARATGYIVETPFKEGDQVKAGDLLFLLDQRPYKAKLDDATGQVKLQQAKLKLAIADNLRAKEVAKTPGAISQQDLDKYQAAEEEARAGVEAIQASLEVHRLNLEFCKVISPIDGRISRYYFTLGNLVNQDQTLLTTIVSENPIYVYFDTDERTILRVIRLVRAGKLRPASDGADIPVYVALADETDFPHQALVNFINNKIDPLTGTVTVRAKLDNPPGPGGVKLFKPGMFCRVRLPLGKPHEAVLVTERAIGTDQGLKFVYVIDSDNKTQYRRVTLGATQPDGLRVIEEGLKPEDRVIVSGIQLVRPGQTVKPDLVPMPTNTPPPAPPKEAEPAEKKADTQ